MPIPFSIEDGPNHIKGVADRTAMPYLEAPQRRQLEQLEHNSKLQQYFQELQATQSLLNSILAVIRYGSQEELIALLECIRSGVSLSQISSHLRSSGRLSQASSTIITGDEAFEDTAEEAHRW
jgi:hypothetical protein